MASWVPSEISKSLSAVDGGLGEIFTNVENVVQTVGSIYDQITGKSQGVPGQTEETYSQSPTVTAPAPAQAPAIPAAPVPAVASEGMLLSSGTALAIGAFVLIGALFLLRD